MRSTIICSVGTSLLSNIKNLNAISNEEEELKRAFEAQNAVAIVKALIIFEPSSRICGAEINTICSLSMIQERYKLDIRNFFFLVSDTQEGIFTGKILEIYLSINWKAIGLARQPNCIIRIIHHLQDQLPLEFKNLGLRNLVKELSKAISDGGGPEACAIDSTGGYKAQIAIAVMFGQMTGVPVFYKHEKFNTIIDFPPMPVAFDYSLYEQYFDLLYRLYQGNETINVKELSKYFEIPATRNCSSEEHLWNSSTFQKFRVFLDEVDETEAEMSKERLFAISPAGGIYFETARHKLGQNFMKNLDHLLPICNKEERKIPHFTDDHFPIGFNEYVTKIFIKYQWIKTIHSVSYEKQRSINGNFFSIRTINTKKELIGSYCDKNGFGARFRIFIKEPTNTSLHAALWLLTESRDRS